MWFIHIVGVLFCCALSHFTLAQDYHKMGEKDLRLLVSQRDSEIDSIKKLWSIEQQPSREKTVLMERWEEKYISERVQNLLHTQNIIELNTLLDDNRQTTDSLKFLLANTKDSLQKYADQFDSLFVFRAIRRAISEHFILNRNFNLIDAYDEAYTEEGGFLSKTIVKQNEKFYQSVSVNFSPVHLKMVEAIFQKELEEWTLHFKSDYSILFRNNLTETNGFIAKEAYQRKGFSFDLHPANDILVLSDETIFIPLGTIERNKDENIESFFMYDILGEFDMGIENVQVCFDNEIKWISES
jgi:hypothetical protein